MDTIDDPVSQLKETTGVETVYDPENNLQDKMCHQYGKRSSQYRLQQRKRPNHYQISEKSMNSKPKSPGVDTNKRPTKPIEYVHLHA